MSFFDRFFSEKNEKDTLPKAQVNKQKQGVSRREFLRDSFLGTAGVILEPKIAAAESLFARPPREEVAALVEAEKSGEFDYLLNPLRIIDDLCEKIGGRSSDKPRSTVENEFLQKFLPSLQEPHVDERRAIIKQAYDQFGPTLVSILEDVEAKGMLSNSYYPLEKFWAVWSNLNFERENTSGALIQENELAQLELLVEWLRPLLESGDYLEQKRAYVPEGDQVERVLDEIFSSQIASGMKYSRSPIFDRQFAASYYIRKNGVLPDNFDILHPATTDEAIHLVSQKDLEVMRTELSVIDQSMPLALKGIKSVSEQDLLHYTAKRGHHTYEQQAVELGGENRLIADWLYEIDTRDEAEGIPHDQFIGARLSRSLCTLVHEINHGYDQQNFMALEQFNLHPQDVLENCTLYQDFYAKIFDLVAPSDPEKKPDQLSSDDLTELFLSKTLPIFGEDEFDVSNSENMNRLFQELSELAALVGSISSVPESDLEKIGLADFFSPANATPLELLQVICQKNDDPDMVNVPFSPGLIDYIEHNTDCTLRSDTYLSPKHIDSLFQVVDRIWTGSVTPESKQDLRITYMELKSSYQFLTFTTLERLRVLYLEENRQSEFLKFENYYFTVRNRILFQLAHCLVGPYGQYVPTWRYEANVGLMLDPVASLSLAKGGSDSALTQIVRYMQEERPTASDGSGAKAIRDLVWDTQIELQRQRAKMLGSDISSNQSIADLGEERTLELFPRLVEDAAARLNIPLEPIAVG